MDPMLTFFLGIVFLALGVLVLLTRDILRKVVSIMADFATLRTTLDGIAADVDVIAAHPAPGSVVTQAQLDEAVASAQSIKDKTAAIVAGLPPVE